MTTKTNRGRKGTNVKKKALRMAGIAIILLVAYSHLVSSNNALESNLVSLRRDYMHQVMGYEALAEQTVELSRTPINPPEIIPDGKGGEEKFTIDDLTWAEKNIIFKESSFRTTAKNPKSSAFGLGQLIRSNRIKYAEAAGFHPDTTDEHEQIVLFRNYVKARYGTAEEAWTFWVNNGYY